MGLDLRPNPISTPYPFKTRGRGKGKGEGVEMGLGLKQPYLVSLIRPLGGVGLHTC